MKTDRLVAWRRVDENSGHSVALIGPAEQGYRCRATEVLAGPDLVLSCTFVIELDRDWATRRVQVDAFAAGAETAVELVADRDRRWRCGDRELSTLFGCADVDIAATPLTNTFPIRRLARLAEGASVTLPVAWIDVPGLEVRSVEQTYTRLGPLTWRYSDPDHGAFVLQVDDEGLVLDYEGFAERVR